MKPIPSTEFAICPIYKRHVMVAGLAGICFECEWERIKSQKDRQVAEKSPKPGFLFPENK